MNDPSTAKSRTGYVISYQGCPITRASKLQTEVVLSTTESEYVGLSERHCIAIVLMNLLKEMRKHGVELPTTNLLSTANSLRIKLVPSILPSLEL
jgi:hypothetical protein